MAISRRRAAALAQQETGDVAHAMRSTSPMTVIGTQSGLEYSCGSGDSPALPGKRVIRWPRRFCRYAAPNVTMSGLFRMSSLYACSSVVSSDSACRTSTPVFSRPTIRSQLHRGWRAARSQARQKDRLHRHRHEHLRRFTDFGPVESLEAQPRSP